jgi:hypothetical protein
VARTVSTVPYVPVHLAINEKKYDFVIIEIGIEVVLGTPFFLIRMFKKCYLSPLKSWNFSGKLMELESFI